MRKTVLLLAVMSLLQFRSSVFSQSLSDYVLSQRGDTLVIKDFADMGNKANSLWYALLLDTLNVPAGRVYGLRAGGLYPHDHTPISSPKHPTVIAGLDATMVVKNTNALLPPPLICVTWLGASQNTGVWGITAGGDLTLENCELVTASTNGLEGSTFTGSAVSNIHLLIDNCIMERTRWVFTLMVGANCNVTFRNCYFVNMNGLPCRRDGGVFDAFTDLDTLLVENCTHINAQGSLYRFRILPVSYRFKRIIVNHNTFVNCAGYAFMNPGYQSNVSLTNNMFINCNIQPYPAIHSIDPGEQDPDWLPMGLVNVFPDSTDILTQAKRKFLVQSNLAYWDPYLGDMNTILNAAAVNGVTNWQSQMIVANARADSMFKHLGPYNTVPYSYLVTDSWKNVLPTFTDPKNLFTTTAGGALYNLKTFALATVDTGSVGSAAVLPDWRLVNRDPDSLIYPDWPIPVNLSYSDPDLKTAGIGGFPLGDLNWFPSQKTAWAAQRATELVKIQDAMNSAHLVATAIAERANLPGTFHLEQNYPNPFNPATAIRYSLARKSQVLLTVYNTLGQHVATLVQDQQEAGSYEVKFDGSALASGMYFYRLQAGIFVDTKKLLFLR